MFAGIGSAAQAAWHALNLLLHSAVSVNPWWLIAGTALHFFSQAVRMRAWWRIIRVAYPHRAENLRVRDVIWAYFAGAGLNGVIPARGGDVLKLYFVHRRVPGSRYATLAGTLIPETLFETTCGIALVVWALARGFLPVPTSRGEIFSIDVSFVIRHPFISTGIAIGVGVGAYLLVRWLRRRGPDLVARIRKGMAIFRRPRDYFEGVVWWQLIGRVIRLGSLACFLAAFHLPVTLGTVFLVMAAQGGGRIIPIAPASAGLRLAMLTYGLVEVTGQSIDFAQISAFSFGVGFVILITGLAISLVLIAREFGTLNPRHALAAARAAVGQWRTPAAGSAG